MEQEQVNARIDSLSSSLSAMIGRVEKLERRRPSPGPEQIEAILREVIDTALDPVLEANHRTAALLKRTIGRVDHLEIDTLPPLEAPDVQVDASQIGRPVRGTPEVIVNGERRTMTDEGNGVYAVKLTAKDTNVRKGPPPGVPTIPAQGSLAARHNAGDRYVDKHDAMYVLLDDGGRVMREERVQVTDPTTDLYQRLTVSRNEWANKAAQLEKERDTARSLMHTMSIDRDAANDARIKVQREADRLRQERDHATKNAQGHSDNADRYHAELIAARKLLDMHEQRSTRVDEKLEHATKRATLADLEWNNAREKINPLIAPEFDGQSLADAVVNTIKVLEAKLRSAQDAGQRAHDDAGRIQREMVQLTDRLAEVQGKAAGRTGTIADQARQIHELRDALAQARAELPAALHRQASQWGQDRAAGQEQVRRLIEENQAQRIELHGFRSAAMTKRRGDQMSELRDRLQTIADESFGPFPVLTLEESVQAIAMGITTQRFARRRGDRFHDQIRAWIDNARGIDGVREVLAAYEKEQAVAQEKAEAEQMAFLRNAGHQPDERHDPACETECTDGGKCNCPVGTGF